MSRQEANTSGVYPEIRWFEDFALGQRFVYGDWLMTHEQMRDFAQLYDPEPFHVDDEAAKQLGWEGMIASGLQLASIWRRLSKDAFPNSQTVVSPGWDNIRWFEPVYAGDRLQASTEIIEVRELSSRPGEGLVRLSNRLTRGDDVISTLVSTWFVRRRSPASST